MATDSKYSQEVIAINAFGLEERRRTSLKTGKVSKRYTVTIKSEPVLGVFDDRVLGKGPAEAIRDIIQKQIRGISEEASSATNTFRKGAANALSRGEPWAVRRYSARRRDEDGVEQIYMPGSSTKLFNDSGRLAHGIHVRENKNEKSWTVNVPAGRMDPEGWGDMAAFTAQMQRLQKLVPEMGNPLAIERHKEFQDSVKKAIEGLIFRADRKPSDMGADILRAYSGLFRQVAALGKGVLI